MRLETKKYLYDIVVLPRGGSETRPYLATPADERGADVSPDGRFAVRVGPCPELGRAVGKARVTSSYWR